nr:unnamed protein product [Spirometra erinaceieuropaei]
MVNARSGSSIKEGREGRVCTSTIVSPRYYPEDSDDPRACLIQHVSSSLGECQVNAVTIQLGNCTTTSLLPLSALSSNASFGNVSPKCYDDYNCDPPGHAYLFYVIFGIVFTVVCSASLLSNLACVVAFNKASNRTGATLYFSAIALADCVHLSILLLLHVPRFLYQTYAEQIEAYAKTTVRYVPKALPFLTFSELASVWLTLCVLADRYTYLRLGFFSRSVTSSTLHLRVAAVVLVLTFCYTIPKFFEFELQPVHDNLGGYRAVLTSVGKSGPFR